jgi:hypothetical protein
MTEARRNALLERLEELNRQRSEDLQPLRSAAAAAQQTADLARRRWHESLAALTAATSLVDSRANGIARELEAVERELAGA